MSKKKLNKKTPATIPVQIEQAIAFGRSLDWIIEHLGVTARDVDDAMTRLDECVQDEPELPPIRCGSHAAYERHKALGEIVDSHCRWAEFQHRKQQKAAA